MLKETRGHLKRQQQGFDKRLHLLFEHGAPTFHSQAGILKVRKADGDGAGPGGSCSPWHDESGSQPVPLPGTQNNNTFSV